MIANWLPEDFLKATILFEAPDAKGNLNPHGTGVLLNYKETFILATCKHVVINPTLKKKYNDLYFTINRNDGSKNRYKIEDIHKKFHLKWYFHKKPEVDLAVTVVAIDQNVDDIKLIPLDQFEEYDSIPLGEDIFFLGFPLGLGVSDNSKLIPLVRGGLIALKDNSDKTFWIDANVYPGSSGSPVFYRPTAADLKTHSFGSGRGVKFLGIVVGNKNYQEWGIILRTSEPRVIFEENAGLGKVFSSTLIRDILNYPEFKAMITRVSKLSKSISENNEGGEN